VSCGGCIGTESDALLIGRRRNRLEVLWVHASAVPTTVVDFITGGNLSAVALVCGPMGVLAGAQNPVAVASSAQPNPAGGREHAEDDHLVLSLGTTDTGAVARKKPARLSG
jgi:hypothetical protein